MFCINCGTKLPEGSKFCISCGTPQPIINAAVPAPVQPAPQNEGVAPAHVQPAPQSEGAAPAPVQPAPQNEGVAPAPAKKKKGKGGIIAVVIIILVLALLGGGAVLLNYMGFFDKGPSMQTAAQYLSEEEYDLAIQAYTAILQQDCQNAEAYKGLARAYLQKGDSDKALSILEDALDKLEDSHERTHIQDEIMAIQNREEPPATAATTTAATTTTTTAATTTTSPVIETEEPDLPLLDITLLEGRWTTDLITCGTTRYESVTCSMEMTTNLDAGISVAFEYGGELSLYMADVPQSNTFVVENEEYSISLFYNESDDIIEMSATADNKEYVAIFSRKKDVPEIKDDGKVLNIACWNDEFHQRMTKFYPGYVDNGNDTGSIGDITVKWIYMPGHNADGSYRDILEYNLFMQDNLPADEKIDIFLVESDYACDYINTDCVLPVSLLGLTEADAAQMYPYTKQIGTDRNGELKAVSWQAPIGVFAYRRSIAKEVIGTDDPAMVQNLVADWTKFDSTAKIMNSKGYYMLSGNDDAFRVHMQGAAAPLVDEQGTIIINEQLLNWVAQSKTYTDSGYNNKHSIWSDGWADDQKAGGKVFGFFYSTWGVNFTLPSMAAEDGYGDWAVCCGPDAYYWGGSYLCAAYQTDNKSLVRDIMYNMTCNSEIMEAMTRDPEVLDYANNIAAIQRIAHDPSYSVGFLGGQNPAGVFHENAMNVELHITPYDYSLSEMFQAAFKDYFGGTITYEEALEVFYSNATTMFPELIRPESVPTE